MQVGSTLKNHQEQLQPICNLGGGNYNSKFLLKFGIWNP